MEAALHSAEQFRRDLLALGLKSGDTLMMHSSFRSLGGIEGGAETVFRVLLEILGENGTLMLPAFSYSSVNHSHPDFDLVATPSCVGYLAEYFRTRVPGVIRSLHATHSCTVRGRLAQELCAGHELDLAPVGPHSPLAKLPDYDGKILILGSPPSSNTIMHGVEEAANAPYVLDYEHPIRYILHDGRRQIEQSAFRHYFHREDCTYHQRYQRVIPLLDESERSEGMVLDAKCYLLSARAVWDKGCQMMRKDPYYFVDRVEHEPASIT